MIFTGRFCFILISGINAVYTESTETDPGPSKKEKVSSASTEKEDAIQPVQVAWPQGVVPYYVDPQTYDDIVATRIRMAMNTIESLSCVLFKAIPLKPPPFAGFMWLHITNPDNERDCRHTTFVGSRGNALLILGYECMQRRDIIHSLMHVLGFNDEVTHPQRDMYIRILWQNIQPKYRPLFRINTDETPQKMMVEYDTMSVMHFHDRAFSSNGGATIAPLISGLLISPSDKLSQLDIMKLRLAFGHECNRRKVGNLFKTCENVLQDDSINSRSHSIEASDNADNPNHPYVENVKPHVANADPHVEHLDNPDHPEHTSVSEHSGSSEHIKTLSLKNPIKKKKMKKYINKLRNYTHHKAHGPKHGHTTPTTTSSPMRH